VGRGSSTLGTWGKLINNSGRFTLMLGGFGVVGKRDRLRLATGRGLARTAWLVAMSRCSTLSPSLRRKPAGLAVPPSNGPIVARTARMLMVKARWMRGLSEDRRTLVIWRAARAHSLLTLTVIRWLRRYLEVSIREAV
jgi:hypothetical protein